MWIPILVFKEYTSYNVFHRHFQDKEILLSRPICVQWNNAVASFRKSPIWNNQWQCLYPSEVFLFSSDVRNYIFWEKSVLMGDQIIDKCQFTTHSRLDLSHAHINTHSPTVVNFINVKRANFTYKSLFSSYVWALNKFSYEKCARKTLMKLTPDLSQSTF